MVRVPPASPRRGRTWRSSLSRSVSRSSSVDSQISLRSDHRASGKHSVGTSRAWIPRRSICPSSDRVPVNAADIPIFDEDDDDDDDVADNLLLLSAASTSHS